MSGLSRAPSAPAPQHPALGRQSLNSDVARLVTVANDTPAPVQLLWVNYEGAPTPAKLGLGAPEAPAHTESGAVRVPPGLPILRNLCRARGGLFVVKATCSLQMHTSQFFSSFWFTLSW